MSDKIKEWVEIPQQFIRDGNQVSDQPPFHRFTLPYSSARSSSQDVRNLHRKVSVTSFTLATYPLNDIQNSFKYLRLSLLDSL